MEQRVFIREDGTVHISCPVCMAVKVVSYGKLPQRHTLTVKCKCGHVFKVRIELRKSFRKDVNFEGRFLLTYQNLRWGKTLSESIETNIKPINCQIVNISLGGICLMVDEIIKLNRNDLIVVKFNLDNSAATEIEKTAVIRNIKDNIVSCEFAEPDHNDKDLRFYFL